MCVVLYSHYIPKHGISLGFLGDDYKDDWPKEVLACWSPKLKSTPVITRNHSFIIGLVTHTAVCQYCIVVYLFISGRPRPTIVVRTQQT